MSELRKRDIKVRYIGTHVPDIKSTRTSEEIAKGIFYEFDDYHFGWPREIIDITVDGETFTKEDLFK